MTYPVPIWQQDTLQDKKPQPTRIKKLKIDKKIEFKFVDTKWKKKHQKRVCLRTGRMDAQERRTARFTYYQSTTFKYDNSEQMARLFDLEDTGYFYTRLQNPTNDAVAAKIAELEGA